MMKTKRVLCLSCVLLFVLMALLPIGASAAAARRTVIYTNPETGYRAEIRDNMNLLTDSERAQLLESMIPITEYGHIGFCSIKQSTSNALEQAREIRKNMFGMDSGSVFVINMNVRQINIQSYGRIYQYITSSKAKSITDNVRRYATNRDYYSAASQAYSQMLTVIEGGVIAEPMRYLSYGGIALMIGMICALMIVFLTRFNLNIRNKITEDANTLNLVVYENVLTSKKVVRTVSSSSGCGGGGGGCGGGGGGCGGGGGSSF